MIIIKIISIYSLIREKVYVCVCGGGEVEGVRGVQCFDGLLSSALLISSFNALQSFEDVVKYSFIHTSSVSNSNLFLIVKISVYNKSKCCVNPSN